MCLMAGQKKFDVEYKDPHVITKIKKMDIEETMESIKEYLRSHCGVIRANLAYVIRKTI